jgi:hypothetical protein
MTYAEFLKLFEKKVKTMSKTKISLEWGISSQHLNYYLERARKTPEYHLPKGKVFK